MATSKHSSKMKTPPSDTVIGYRLALKLLKDVTAVQDSRNWAKETHAEVNLTADV